jgi:hypothetical protein
MSVIRATADTAAFVVAVWLILERHSQAMALCSPVRLWSKAASPFVQFQRQAVGVGKKRESLARVFIDPD